MKDVEVADFLKKITWSNPRKVRNAQAKIDGYLLKSKHAVEIVERMKIVAKTLFNLRSKNVEACDSVWQEFFCKLFSENRLDVVMEFFYNVEMSSRKKGSKPPSRVNEGCERATLEFHKLIGSSDERTISFCLYMLEVLSQYLQSLINMSKGEKLDDHQSFAVIGLLSASVALPLRKEIPLSQWFHRLIRIAESNDVALEIFRSIVGIMTDSGRKEIAMYEMSDASLNECLAFQAEYASIFKVPVMAMSSRNELAVVHRLFVRIREQNSERLEDGESLLSWFLENKQRIMELKTLKCAEIVNRPARGLRSGGADHIAVDVSPLYAIGVQSVVLYPESCIFPNVNICVLVRKWTPHPLIFRGSIDQFCLNIPPNTLENAIFKDVESLRELLEYVIIDALHRIIVVQKEAVVGAARERTGSGKRKSEKAIETRPHFRRLPQGSNASDAAIERAKSCHGWSLPPGKTYVSGYYRNGRIEYNKSTEPVFVYNDAFVRRSLE